MYRCFEDDSAKRPTFEELSLVLLPAIHEQLEGDGRLIERPPNVEEDAAFMQTWNDLTDKSNHTIATVSQRDPTEPENITPDAPGVSSHRVTRLAASLSHDTMATASRETDDENTRDCCSSI